MATYREFESHSIFTNTPYGGSFTPSAKQTCNYYPEYIGSDSSRNVKDYTCIYCGLATRGISKHGNKSCVNYYCPSPGGRKLRESFGFTADKIWWEDLDALTTDFADKFLGGRSSTHGARYYRAVNRIKFASTREMYEVEEAKPGGWPAYPWESLD